MKRLAKAYKINLAYIEESYLYESQIVYAKNRKEAKMKLANYHSYDDMTHINGEKLNVYNIRVKRVREYDTVLYCNLITLRHVIKSIKKLNKLK